MSPNLGKQLPTPFLYGKLQMTNAEYHAAPGISASNLEYLEESVLHLEKKHLFTLSSPALDLGALVHALVLEPELVKTGFFILPKLDLRTNAGKAQKKELEDANQDKILISEDDYQTALIMRRNVLALAGNLFKQGEAEQSFFADDEGLLLKCRPDFYIERLATVIDLKTTADISEYGLKKTIASYRYDRAAVFYPKVLRLLGLEAQRFIFVFVESKPPHLVKIRDIHPNALELAEVEVEALLDKYRAYKLSGKADLYKTILPFSIN